MRKKYGIKMQYEEFFWLHVKKSAGEMTRALLQPHYIEVDRVKKPKTFIQARREEFNDILNNYRVPLGIYQFKRCLFARDFLYRDRWPEIYSFAFCREPIERCISMFFYLFENNIKRSKVAKYNLKRIASGKKIESNTSYAFDAFLDCVEGARSSDSIYWPIDSRFTTHTAPMWDDVTDFYGNVLLKRIFRLENLTDGINQAFEKCGIDKRVTESVKRINENENRREYSPTRRQIRKITSIYAKDFELYEQSF